MYWHSAIETLSPSQLAELKLTRLKETVARAARQPLLPGAPGPGRGDAG